MKFIAKYSGKKVEWATEALIQNEPQNEPKVEWTFDVRPGGWIIGVRLVDGVPVDRSRFYYSRNRHHFFAKLTRGTSLDFQGERISKTREGAQGSLDSDYITQFPGKVRKILVSDGEIVTQGTPLIMVEAMKMEFAIKSNHAGKIKKILVEEGMILTPGQKLLDFEVLASEVKNG